MTDLVMFDMTVEELKGLGMPVGEAKLFHKEAAKLASSAPASPAPAASAGGGGAAAATIGTSKLAASTPPTRHHPQAMLDTVYRGVIDIVSGYTPSHSCSDSMLLHLPAVLPEVVRMDFIVQECTRKLESLQHSAPAVKLPPDMALAVIGYTYDLGLSSATDDGRFWRHQACTACVLLVAPYRPHHSPAPPSDNLFVSLNNMLRKRDSTKVQHPPPPPICVSFHPLPPPPPPAAEARARLPVLPDEGPAHAARRRRHRVRCVTLQSKGSGSVTCD